MDADSMEHGKRPGVVAIAANFFKWVLVIVGSMVAYLVITMVSYGAVSYASALAYKVSMGIDEMQPTVEGMSEALGNPDLMAVQITCQLLVIVVMLLWRRHLRKRDRSFLTLRRSSATMRPDLRGFARSALGLLVLGLAIQLFLGMALGVVFSFFPQLGSDYNAHMEEGGLDAVAWLPMLSVIVLAPISEELMDRGVVFEFALRAVCPAWNKRQGASNIRVSGLQFWSANLLQALSFGILHMNLVQTSYATAIGLILGAVYWRTGRLRYGMLLHLGVNLSSYILEPLLNAFAGLGALGDVGVLALMALAGYCGARLFLSATGRATVPHHHRLPAPALK